MNSIIFVKLFKIFNSVGESKVVKWRINFIFVAAFHSKLCI